MTFKTSDVTSGTRDVNAHMLFPVVEPCRDCAIKGHSVVTKLRVLIDCFLFPTTVLRFVQEVTKQFKTVKKKLDENCLGNQSNAKLREESTDKPLLNIVFQLTSIPVEWICWIVEPQLWSHFESLCSCRPKRFCYESTFHNICQSTCSNLKKDFFLLTFKRNGQSMRITLMLNIMQKIFWGLFFSWTLLFVFLIYLLFIYYFGVPKP